MARGGGNQLYQKYYVKDKSWSKWIDLDAPPGGLTSDPAICSWGSGHLDTRLLRRMLELANRYTHRVAEIAGGSHSSTSRHYAGVAFDVDTINGQRVSGSNDYYRAFMQRCRDLGATEVLGPGDAGHSSHIHAAWSRP